jgi:recombination protein RecT
MASTNALATVSEYMRSDLVRERFAETIGSQNAGPFITSVLLAVANSPTLQECDMRSIYGAALRAATLRLSCDPGTKQAYIVPFKGKATLVVGYKGLYDLALRTGKYRWINVSPIYEGETVELDRISGKMTLGGGKTSSRVIGYVSGFEMVNGFSKTITMTVEEIHEHAKKYSKGYDRPDGPWKKATEAMERKTILRNLLQNWGYLEPADQQALHMTETEDETVEGEVVEAAPEPEEIDQPEPEQRSVEENLAQLGF